CEDYYIFEKDEFDYFIQTLIDDWNSLSYHVFWKNILSIELDKQRAMITRALMNKSNS
ncbi:42070_t:CDS:1, partial [Gigaspora margarita]